jgi:hypothetical protein
MDARPLVIAAVLLVAFVVALVAVPVAIVRQVFNPVTRPADTDE